MTISVPGVDNGFTYPGIPVCPTLAWAAHDQQTEAGRVAITVHNQSARFPERLIERLLLHHAFGLAIGGAIHETGAPVERRVRLYRRSDGQFVGETLSNAEGVYRIGNMPADVLHYAIALDDLGVDPNFNALILDQLVGGEVPEIPVPQAIIVELPDMPMDWGGSIPGYQQWRIASITLPGVHCEISEIRVFSGGVDVTDDATKSSSDAVFSGVFANLFDGNLSNVGTWTKAVIEAPGFYIQFDFATPVMLDGVKQGAYDNNTRYINAFSLQYYDGSTWQTLGSKSSLPYPGNHTLSALYSFP